MKGVVLALDLGSKCGFAVRRADGRIESGTEIFAPKNAAEHPGARFSRFRAWLVDMKQWHPELAGVVYEDVAFIGGPQAAYAVQVYGGFLALLHAFCYHHQLPSRGFAVPTVKKRFVGSGKASKEDVIAQCRALGFNPKTDNEADAIAVLHVGTSTEPLLTPTGVTPKGRKRGARTLEDAVPTGNPF